MFKYGLNRFKSSKSFSIIFGIYILFCIVSVIFFASTSSIRNMLVSLAWLFIPVIGAVVVEYLFKIELVPIFLILILFLAAGGGIIGPCYDLYAAFPIWDDILHTFAGLIFACFGFGISQSIIKTNQKHSFYIHLVFGIMFSLSIAVIWEMIEYAGTEWFGLDMQEDQIIYSLRSYLLAGSHLETTNLDGITQTIIHYGDGKQYIINGYLDIGLYDTLNDMLVCTIGTIVFIIVMIINNCTKGKLDKILIPQLVTNESLE